MELKTFVAESLRQIVAGVQSVQAEHAITDANRNTAPRIGNASYVSNESRQTGLIEFDIAVVSNISGSVEGNASIKAGVWVLGETEGAIGGNAAANRSHENRLRFSIPVTWPGQPGR